MTTAATANGLVVLMGTIRLPRVGAWVAELDLVGEDAKKVSGSVTVTVGSATFKGTATESGAFVGRTKVRLIGGAAGLGKPTQPKFYAAMPARTVIGDLLKEGGEVLSAKSDAGVLGTILPFWTRHAGTVGEGLENVLDEIGATWRVLTDGSVWIGKETWPKATVTDVNVESEDPKDSKIVFASESPTLLPGTTFRDRKVARVEHEIATGKTRTVARFETSVEGSSNDPIRATIEGLVRQNTKHVDFYAVRAGRIVAQNGDGTLEIKLDDAEMPGLSKIPIAYGIPGVTAKVKKGGRVHVEFAEGSPTKPRAVVVDSSALEELTVNATKEVAIKATSAASVMVGGAKLELEPAKATLAAPMVDLGMAPSGVATQLTLAPLVAGLSALMAALQPFCLSPVAGVSGGTSAGVQSAAAALQVVLALPTNFSQTVKAGS